MPTFTFTSPDGRKFKITAPEGTTKEQAFQMLQKHMPAAASKDDGPIDQGAAHIAIGAGKGLARVGVGAAQIGKEAAKAAGISWY